MTSIDPCPPAARDDAEQLAAPPQSRLVFVVFPNETNLNQAITVIATKFIDAVYRSAVVSKGVDGRISVRDLTEEADGTVVAAALLGGVSGLAGGPLGATLGAAAGALVGWSAELVNEGAVTEFAKKKWSELAPGRRAVLAEVSADAVSSFETLMAANGGVVYK